MELIKITPQEAEAWPSRKRAHFFNTLSGYKPVHVIGTQNKEGQNNLAIFSQVVHLGANPPLIGVVFRPSTVERHTLKNIQAINFFTLNHVHQSFFQKAHHTAAKYTQSQSEFNEVKLTPQYSSALPSPYVQESHVRIGLKLVDIQLIKANKTNLVIGEIIEVFYPQNAIKEDGYLDLAQLETVCCTGLDAYHLPKKLARLSYAQPHEKPTYLNPELF